MSTLGFITFMALAWAVGKYGVSGVVRATYRFVRSASSKVDQWIAQEEQAIRKAIKDEQ